MNHQISLFDEIVTMISIDKSKNRFRAYQVEFKKSERCIIKKWGRVSKKGRNWMLKNNKWQQEVEIGKDVEGKELEKAYQRILKTRERNGYEYYIGRLFL